MRDDVLVWGAVGLCLVMVVTAVLGRRRRPPGAVVTTRSARVRRAREVLSGLPRQPAPVALGRAIGDGASQPEQPAGRLQLALDVVYVLVLVPVLWVTFGAQHMLVAAATGDGLPGVMVIEGLRPARGADIPVGTFIERDGTTTEDVAWQDRPATVGERKQGVRVGDRAWAPGVRLSPWDVLVMATLVGLFSWRLVVLLRHWRRWRHPPAG